MSIRLREREFELAFSGPAVVSGLVPAAALAQALNGFQRAATLIAAEQEQQEARQQESALAGWSWHHTIFCSAAGVGEPIFFASVGDPLAEATMEKHIQTVSDKFADVIQALMTSDEKALEQATPDPLRRRRVLRALLGALPTPGTGVEVRARRRGSSQAISSSVLASRLEKALAKPVPGQQPPQIVNGELISLDFRGRRLSLKMAKLNLDVICECPPDIMELLEHLQTGGYIQVLGRFVPGRDSAPDRIEDVRDIRPLDLSPIHLSEIERGGRCLVLDPPAMIPIKLDKDGRQLCAEWPALGARAAAATRSRLIEALEKKLLALWGRYSRLQTGGETPTPDEADRARRALRIMSMRPAGWRLAKRRGEGESAAEWRAAAAEVFEPISDDSEEARLGQKELEAAAREVFDDDDDNHSDSEE